MCKACGKNGECRECLPGLILNESNKICICPSNQPLFILSKKICIANCPKSSTYEPIFKECVEKKSCGVKNCKNCKAHQCLMCHDGFFLKNDICYPICGEGTYLDELAISCMTCSEKCHSCQITSDKCISCPLGYFLDVKESSCKENLNCSNGFYFSTQIFSCATCHQNCLTCTGSEINDCLSCTSDKIFKDQNCLPCTLPGYILNKTNNTCDSICGDGLRLGYEKCDDGNLKSNDGCSSFCKVEKGYFCYSNDKNMKDSCVLRPKPLIILDVDDPSNLILRFDRPMDPEYICNIELYFNKIHKEDSKVNIYQSSNQECFIHIDYNKTSKGDTIFILFKNYNSVKDTNGIKIEDDELHVKLNGYIFETSRKEEMIKITALIMKGTYWLLIIVILSSIPLVFTNSKFLFWNLLDFMQRISLFSCINFERPFSLNKFFEVFQLAQFVSHGSISAIKLKFIDAIINLLILSIFSEIISQCYSRYKKLSNVDKTQLIWSNRLLTLNLIIIPLFLNIFKAILDNLNHEYRIFNLGIAITVGLLYIIIIKKIYQDLCQFDIKLMDLEDKLHILLKYRYLLEEVNLDISEGKIFQLQSLIARILIVLVVSLNEYLTWNAQIILIGGIEAIQIFIIQNKNIIWDEKLKILLYLQQILMVILWSGIGYIHYNPDAEQTIKFCWIYELVISGFILVIFGFNITRVLTRILLKIRLNLDNIVDQWGTLDNGGSKELEMSQKGKEVEDHSIDFKISDDKKEIDDETE